MALHSLVAEVGIPAANSHGVPVGYLGIRQGRIGAGQGVARCMVGPAAGCMAVRHYPHSRDSTGR